MVWSWICIACGHCWATGGREAQTLMGGMDPFWKAKKK